MTQTTQAEVLKRRLWDGGGQVNYPILAFLPLSAERCLCVRNNPIVGLFF